jgi:hypothetical protein
LPSPCRLAEKPVQSLRIEHRHSIMSTPSTRETCRGNKIISGSDPSPRVRNTPRGRM